MILRLFHPAVANRDCAHCLLYDYDETSGECRKGRDDKPELRIAACPPPCRTSNGCPKGTAENQKSLTPENEECFAHYMECRAVGVFPDDPVVRRNARVIREVEDWAAKKERAEFEMAVISAVACR